MRRNMFLPGVVSTTLILGSLTLPGNSGFSGMLAQAAEEVASGTCGENLTWVLDDEGKLTISGSGEMDDYGPYSMPWHDYLTSITSVEIDDDVTHLGTCAFIYCTGLADDDGFVIVRDILYYYAGKEAEVEVPEGVTVIGCNAFSWNSYIESVKLPAGVTTIEASAFAFCTNLTTIEIPNSLETVETSAFMLAGLEDVYYTGSKDEWKEISIDNASMGNINLRSANIHYDSSVSSSDYTMGDINEDGSIDYLDAMMVLRYDAELVTFTDSQLLVGDVNGDGLVDSLDAILILRYDAGLIDSFN